MSPFLKEDNMEAIRFMIDEQKQLAVIWQDGKRTFLRPEQALQRLEEIKKDYDWIQSWGRDEDGYHYYGFIARPKFKWN